MDATIKALAYLLGIVGMAGVWLVPSHLVVWQADRA